MTYPNRNRSAEKKARKKRDTLLLLNLILLIFIVTGGIFLWKEYSNSQQEASKPESSQVSKASPSEEASQPSSTNQKKEEIKWVKQDKPVKLPILMYHAIHVMDPSEAANSGLIVDPETFESHLKALKEAGYYTLSPAEAYKALTENVLPENKKVVWLTFDDSLKDFYTQAYPILQKYQMKATNNVITGFVQAGREDILTLDEIKEMKKNGMSFEDHTVNHPDLSVSSADTQNSELQDSKEYLDHNLSQTTTTVAYPSGRYSETTLQLAEKLGYKMGLTTNNGLASLSDGLLSLNRVRVNPTTTAQSLLDEIAN
ncbi:Poly-beta-1,6-N-acetyl-D-glucosamine N-deacetylase precursor [Streptococcus gordonii]|uniref:polysaccharide deacetylase family protein n=1 Tax=Streptococcus gordonii TaxID=1302 RepID=UPI000F660CC8|nr:polysaccharide deacetylase family protein [Streptococcus gordonii]RSJ54547.1 Poly-beta-1,6-N-acetyl-D-glucosamine N-deacetylase precursor [Streptococcus gordonii]